MQRLEKLPRELDPVWRATINVTAANGWLALGDQESAIGHLIPALGVPIDEVGEVIATMIGATACMIEELPGELVAFAVGADEQFHSASQPMLRAQLDSGRKRAIADIGAEAFETEHRAGRSAPLDVANSRLGFWLSMNLKED